MSNEFEELLNHAVATPVAGVCMIALSDAKAIQEHIKRLNGFEAAYLQYDEKTQWVQDTAKGKELGLHRADVLRQRIAELEATELKLHAKLAESVLQAQLGWGRYKNASRLNSALLAELDAQPTSAQPAQQCFHDETERLGAIWTRCTQCDKSWADDDPKNPFKQQAAQGATKPPALFG